MSKLSSKQWITTELIDDDEFKEALIDFVRNNTILYDTSLKEFKDKDRRFQVWAEFAGK